MYCRSVDFSGWLMSSSFSSTDDTVPYPHLSAEESVRSSSPSDIAAAIDMKEPVRQWRDICYSRPLAAALCHCLRGLRQVHPRPGQDRRKLIEDALRDDGEGEAGR